MEKDAKKDGNGMVWDGKVGTMRVDLGSPPLAGSNDACGSKSALNEANKKSN